MLVIISLPAMIKNSRSANLK